MRFVPPLAACCQQCWQEGRHQPGHIACALPPRAHAEEAMRRGWRMAFVGDDWVWLDPDGEVGVWPDDLLVGAFADAQVIAALNDEARRILADGVVDDGFDAISEVIRRRRMVRIADFGDAEVWRLRDGRLAAVWYATDVCRAAAVTTPSAWDAAEVGFKGRMPDDWVAF